MVISSNRALLSVDGKSNRVTVGINTGAATNKGSFNVVTNTDNGVFVRCIKGSQKGLTVEMRNNNDVAIRVLGANGNNFSVLKSGQVYARRYVTTLNNIPDYVFDEEYTLLSIEELQKYIEVNHHLPNIPSAEEYTKEGVDLGELNRLLLEKVEELTLYIIQLNSEIKVLKENK